MIEEVGKAELTVRPKERVLRLFFDNNEDQDAFRMFWCALCYCEPNFQDVRQMFTAARLFAKLEKFSIPAPDNIPPLGLRRQRMLPPYPGHPVSLDLTPAEMGLVEICLQVVPWRDLSMARAAALTLEWMLKAEVVELDLLSVMEKQAEAAYEAGTLFENGEKVR